MRRHQPREAGPDTRNTSPRGRGEQGVPLPGDPHPEPSGPSSRSATANTPSPVAGTPQAPSATARPGSRGCHLQGLPIAALPAGK